MDDANHPPAAGEDLDAAERLLAKVRAFVQHDLDDDERALFAQLLAPGVAEAHGEAVEDVAGFGDMRQSLSLPERLARAVRQQGLRIVIDPR
jgi:hypothetical protein